ncbi:MAG TPA: right-handed parallel beta-helix repeat-containing protein [Ignavibacteriales bacterium]|nr:right-handed parallel beta-helix repeat-containing protein [Ignavibacteriales bacterium]
MKNILLFSFLFFILNFEFIFARSIDVSGTISENTTWQADTVRVNGDLTVLDNVKLTVMPHTVVMFTGPYKIDCQGSLSASGTKTDSIVFTAKTRTEGWAGIRFNNPNGAMNDNDSSVFSFCRFEYCRNLSQNYTNKTGGAVFVSNFSKVKISDCLFYSNTATYGGAVFVTGTNIQIQNSSFIENSAAYSGGALYFTGAKPLISSCSVNNNNAAGGNGGGVYLEGSDAVLYNCLFINNSGVYGAGVQCYRSSAKVINNTICNNNTIYGGSGIICVESSPEVINTIIYGNTVNNQPGSGSQVFLTGENSDPYFTNSTVQLGKEGFGGNGSGIYYDSSRYTNTYIFDPQFVNPSKGSGNGFQSQPGDWTLKSTSPYINAGIQDTSGLKLPSTDLMGNARVSYGRIDMGALEFQGQQQFIPGIYSRTKDVAFLPVKTGSVSREKQVVFSNSGSADLVIDRITAPEGFKIKINKSDAFTSQVNNVTVKPLKDTTLYIVFSPLAARSYSAGIEIHNNTAQNPVFSISVSGKGTYFQEYAGTIYEDMIWSDTVHVTGDINMKGSLTVKPGTYVEFQGLYQLNIGKRLLALGTAQDSIRFTPKDKQTGWKGISFLDYYADMKKDSSKLEYCIIEYGKGSDDFPGLSGGGIYINKWQNISISNSSIRNNSATLGGGGIFCQEANLRVYNSSIYNNRISGQFSFSGGGGLYFKDSPAIIKTSIIKSNYSQSEGGGIYSRNSNLLCTNNVIEGNKSLNNGAGLYSFDGSLIATDNKFLNNSINNDLGYISGGGLYCEGNARIENNIFENNAGGLGGAINLFGNADIHLTGNIIQKNKATAGGGIYGQFFSPEITGNHIMNNTANVGGGIYMGFGSPRLTNNLICNNSAVYDGGAIYLDFNSPVFVNNTIANNSAVRGASVFSTADSRAKFYNTIISGSRGANITGQIFKDGNTTLTFNYCSIQGGINGIGDAGSSHVIDYDPSFVKPSAGAGSDFDAASADWTLKGNSLCINAGTPDTSGLKIPALDLSGNQRIKDIVDIGAFEFHGTIINTPAIAVTRDSLSFQKTTVGQSDITDFIIRNEGRGDLNITSINAPAEFGIKFPSDSLYKNSLGSFTIKPGSDTSLSVSFHPSAPGSFSGVISIKSNDNASDSLGVYVSGISTNDLIIRGNIAKSAQWKGTVDLYGEVTILKGVKITIAPGTSVVFSPDGALNIQGSLTAVGTMAGRIKFVSMKSDSGWQGININNIEGIMSSTDTTKFIYCRIEGATRCAISIKRFSALAISNCTFSNNTLGAIFCDRSSSPLISNNTFTGNKSYVGAAVFCQYSSNPRIINNIFNSNHADDSGGAIYCNYSSSPLITGNTFTKNTALNGGVIATQDTAHPKMTGNFISANQGTNGGVAFCFNSSKLTMINNIIADNIGYEGGVFQIGNAGVAGENSFVTLVNNTICGNRGGKNGSVIKSLYGSSSFLAVNTIFCDNISPDGKQIVFGSLSSPYIINCDVQGGTGSIQNEGSYDFATHYLNNIDADPLFAKFSDTGDPSPGSIYSLSAKSPCINRGISDTLKYNIPMTDFAGKPRFIGSSIDIGALEYQLPVSVSAIKPLPEKYSLEQNYPNPFNPSTTIRYSLVKESRVRLYVYNSIGALAADLADEVLPAGEYEKTFNAINLSSGIYYNTIIIQSTDGKDNFRFVRKMLLLK